MAQANVRDLTVPIAWERPILVVDAPGPASILAIAAHPDDIESWCGGTLAQAIDQGSEVRLLLVTSGDKGSSDPTTTPVAVGAQREVEALAAAKALGITEVTFLRYPDGEVEDTRVLRRDLVTWIRRWRPEIVFTHDPEHPLPPYLSHRDHRVVGRVVLDTLYPLARDPLTFPELLTEGLAPHVVRKVWLFASRVADTYVDISAGFERKILARLAHASQTPDPAALPDNWRSRAAEIGIVAQVSLAEAFTVLRLE